MLEIDRRLSESGLPIQLVLICGKNERLQRELRAQVREIPRLVEGFTTSVPYYMQLADFFIGKPGPGSIAEAMAMGLPVIVERNAWTLPQERYNAGWGGRKRGGRAVPGSKRTPGAVNRLRERTRFRGFQSKPGGWTNRA